LSWRIKTEQKEWTSFTLSMSQRIYDEYTGLEINSHSEVASLARVVVQLRLKTNGFRLLAFVIIWLVVWNMFYFSIQLGIISQLTKSYFSEG
jgi:hypothetical protein